MPRLHDRTSVERPVGQAQERLEKFLASLRGKDGICRLRLRVPMNANPYGLSLDRAVHIEATRPRDEQTLDGVIQITWSPEGNTIFPRFEGTLAVYGEGADPGVSYIELDGSYVPPFGPAGQLFDAAIGRRIAQATAREFLKDVKAAIEREPSESL
jgi:hypothetical protein